MPSFHIFLVFVSKTKRNKTRIVQQKMRSSYSRHSPAALAITLTFFSPETGNLVGVLYNFTIENKEN